MQCRDSAVVSIKLIQDHVGPGFSVQVIATLGFRVWVSYELYSELHRGGLIGII